MLNARASALKNLSRMPAINDSLKDQIHRNLVAIISLTVALVSLSYNTWRNEQTEHNRNIRQASFEILLKLGELDQVVFFIHFEKDETRGSPRTGWAYVLTIRDLSNAAPAPVPETANGLLATWEANWTGLGEDPESQVAISNAIDTLRGEVLEALRALD